MRSRDLVRDLKRLRGWIEKEKAQIRPVKESVVRQEHRIQKKALEYIYDEANHADMVTIKRAAGIALGRDQS